MQLHKLGHIAHLGALREFHAREYSGYHLGAYEIVVVEGPSPGGVEVLGLRFGYVVEQGGPAKHDIVAFGGYGVEHAHSVQEVVLVAVPFYNVDTFEPGEFGQYDLQQAAVVEQAPARRRTRRGHDFKKLVLDALAGEDLDTLRVAAQSLEGFRRQSEIELCGEADGAEHTQRVVAERYVGVERCADDAFAYVGQTVVKVDDLAEVVGVDADSHGVDGEVAAGYVFFERAVLDHRVARRTVVGLAACADEFQFEVAAAYLCGAVAAVDIDMRAAAEASGDCLRQVYARTDGHEVDVLRVAAYYQVAYVTAYDVARAPDAVGRFSYGFEYAVV